VYGWSASRVTLPPVKAHRRPCRRNASTEVVPLRQDGARRDVTAEG
jgi:hypothetical protein